MTIYIQLRQLAIEGNIVNKKNRMLCNLFYRLSSMMKVDIRYLMLQMTCHM